MLSTKAGAISVASDSSATQRRPAFGFTVPATLPIPFHREEWFATHPAGRDWLAG